MFEDDRLPERFWEKVEPCPTSGCWHWTAAKDQDGYGMFRWDGGARRAHRVSYTELVGPIPEGLQIDHLCRNRGCVNPAHLEPVTNRENVLRGENFSAKNAVKTHCDNGHEFDEGNTYIRRGKRQCRACNREQTRAYRARKKAAKTAVA